MGVVLGLCVRHLTSTTAKAHGAPQPCAIEDVEMPAAKATSHRKGLIAKPASEGLNPRGLG